MEKLNLQNNYLYHVFRHCNLSLMERGSQDYDSGFLFFLFLTGHVKKYTQYLEALVC